VFDEFDLPSDAFLILTVGRVEPQKGHRYLVEAMAALRQRLGSARVVIVGRSGHASPMVERLVEENGLEDVIRLVGGRRDVRRLLVASDLFVFPSLFEGNGGNAMIEAMAAGLPIITTGASPMTDLIPNSEFGVLVDRCDSHGLAEAIHALANDRDRRKRLGEAARERASGFSSPAQAARAHQEWYATLLEQT
jgi:glycosyltransferase involved in cell wall biosynthesis